MINPSSHIHGDQCQHHPHDEQVAIHRPEDFEGMRRAGKLTAEVLDFITPFVKAGVTTGELDQLCHDFIVSKGAIAAPLGYHGYPKSVCTSVNHVVCHGIPGAKKLNEGDILNIDVSVILDGWFGDASRMFCIGKVGVRAAKLVNVTYEALMQAIDSVRPGITLGDIGHIIQTHVEKNGFSVVRDFCGHGIGRQFHQDPQILHFGKPGTGLIVQEGMFFTIEPMVNAGHWGVKILEDGWTAVTRDKSLSAQWEHTIGVTKDGVEIFTLS